MEGSNDDFIDTESIESLGGSDSTESEERLKRLFQSCDRDKDGFIDRLDIRINW